MNHNGKAGLLVEHMHSSYGKVNLLMSSTDVALPPSFCQAALKTDHRFLDTFSDAALKEMQMDRQIYSRQMTRGWMTEQARTTSHVTSFGVDDVEQMGFFYGGSRAQQNVEDLRIDLFNDLPSNHKEQRGLGGQAHHLPLSNRKKIELELVKNILCPHKPG